MIACRAGMKVLALMACAGVLCLAGPARGWGGLGHRMVCEGAWISLREETRAKVLDLLDLAAPADFAAACARAGDGGADGTAAHFISVPKGATEVVAARDCPAGTSCLLNGIADSLAVLRSGAHKAARAAALTTLAHLVGDLHQPLHVGYAEDRHGRSIAAVYEGRDLTLHALWDDVLVEADPLPPERAVNRYRALTPGERTFDWVEAPPLVWANESLAILRTPATGYVGNPGGLAFGAVYIAQNQPVARDRIARAGARLAHLIEDMMRFWP